MNTPNKNAVTSVSFNDAHMLTRGKSRAKSMGLSFSQYICKLLKDDLSQGGPIVLTPSAEGAGVSSTGQETAALRSAKGFVRHTARIAGKQPATPE